MMGTDGAVGGMVDEAGTTLGGTEGGDGVGRGLESGDRGGLGAGGTCGGDGGTGF